MKKEVPFLIRINSEHSPVYGENILLWRYGQILENQYAFPPHDFYSYCGIIIKQKGIDSLPEKFSESISINGELIREVRFELIRYKLNDNIDVNDDDLSFFKNVMEEKIKERKRIIKKEVTTTNPGGKLLNNLGPKNSGDYLRLLELTSQFENITLLDWFIPIVLKYDRLIHIFVKHVEETKFGKGLFKKRTFFTYKPEEIWILIKTVVKREAEDIKDHFLENRVGYDLGYSQMKNYYRGETDPVLLDGDKFVLKIDKNGFIVQFYQI